MRKLMRINRREELWQGRVREGFAVGLEHATVRKGFKWASIKRQLAPLSPSDQLASGQATAPPAFRCCMLLQAAANVVDVACNGARYLLPMRLSAEQNRCVFSASVPASSVEGVEGVGDLSQKQRKRAESNGREPSGTGGVASSMSGSKEPWQGGLSPWRRSGKAMQVRQRHCIEPSGSRAPRIPVSDRERSHRTSTRRTSRWITEERHGARMENFKRPLQTRLQTFLKTRALLRQREEAIVITAAKSPRANSGGLRGGSGTSALCRVLKPGARELREGNRVAKHHEHHPRQISLCKHDRGDFLMTEEGDGADEQHN
ncbi:hypothetical protein NA57DRAFT_59199 [Rhizodiscina lignyota]|uniref:Uncharacterized protein n=1 Tax=Rhizodiscina lignyota TaxID=1504668 RepID=A0A9P4I6N9_9PEZI|nr:hypothetical protein NA57DRAFT_59199 [Rhizodiscina lignyota]